MFPSPKFRANGSEQGLRRVLPESFLKSAHQRVTEPNENMIGPRESQNVVPHAIRLAVPLNQEAFFAAFHMARQRAISKPELGPQPWFVDDIHDPSCIEPPESHDVAQHGNGLTGL